MGKDKDIEAIAREIVDSAFKVHKPSVLACSNLPINNVMLMNSANEAGKL